MSTSFSSLFSEEAPTEKSNSFSSLFDQPKESFGGETARDVGSLVQGVLSATPYGLTSGGLSLLAMGESIGEMEELEERIPELMEKFPQAPWPEGYSAAKAKEDYARGLKEVSETFPTVANISKEVEDITGLPFNPKTPFQNFLSFYGGTFKLAPGNLPEKLIRTQAGAATRESLIQMGMNEEAADLFGIAASQTRKDQIGANILKRQRAEKEGREFAKTASEREKIFEGTPPDEPPPEVPPGAPPPGEGSITAPEKYFKSDYEIAEDIQTALSPLNIEIVPTTAKAKEIDNLLSPVSETLDAISPHTIQNPRLLGAESARAVQRVSNKIYKDVGEAWNEFRAFASDVSSRREGLVGSLTDILEGMQVPQTKTSQKLYDLAKKLRSAARKRPLSNEELADAIIEARKGFQYDIHGGVESHRINEYIRAIENELLPSMSEAEQLAYQKANQAYADWAQVFKNKKIMPYRFKGISSPRSLYRNSLNPDTLNLLIPILEQDSRGSTLANILRRDLAQNSLAPFLNNPKGMNPFAIQQKLGNLRGILPDQTIQELETGLANAHLSSLQAPVTPVKNPFLHMDENQISRYLDKISGLKELEGYLKDLPGGREQFDLIKKTKGIDKLFGGQMDLPSKSARLSRLLNDRNGQHYLKYTLGDNVYNELKHLDNQNKLQSALKRVEESKELFDMATDPDILMKGGELMASLIRGKPIEAIRRGYQFAKKYAKAKRGEKSIPELSYEIP